MEKSLRIGCLVRRTESEGEITADRPLSETVPGQGSRYLGTAQKPLSHTCGEQHAEATVQALPLFRQQTKLNAPPVGTPQELPVSVPQQSEALEHV
jgi:hypothetical protein